MEFDEFSGIHYSLSFPAMCKAIEEYCSYIKSINIVCNSVDSIDYIYRIIKSSKLD